LLFIIVMDAVSEYVRHDVPWDMLYADDLILSDISSTNLQKRFGEWQEALESKGLKVNADKTETMVSARTAEPLQISRIKQGSETSGEFQIPGLSNPCPGRK